MQVGVPTADILKKAGGARLRQALFGEPVKILRQRGDFVRIRASKDGYEGVMSKDDLIEPVPITHRVTALATHVYSKADLKSPETMTLSFGSRLTVLDFSGKFGRLKDGGFVPRVHIQLAHRRFADPAGVAEMFLGTPYLWGGNSRLGIDCSGLVQIACLACGITCAGDTSEQIESLGEALKADDQLRRGDVIFWKGHVAIMSSESMIVHANAHHMAVVREPLADAQARISADGGEIIARRRLNMFKAKSA